MANTASKALQKFSINNTIANTVKKTVPKVSKKIVKHVNPTEVFRLMVNAYRECIVTREEEQTRRRQIASDEKTAIEEIKARRDILMDYLDRSFDERKNNFAQLFDTLDKAIELNNTEVIAYTLNTIIELGKSNPFKDLGSVSEIRRALEDPNKQFEL
jgi:hypothetical protein